MRHARFSSLVRQPLQEIADVNLIGLVIAGQRVHHKIDAAAQRQFMLARSARHQRIEAVAILVRRPAGGEIIRGDQVGETPSPARAGRAPSAGFGGGEDSIQVWPFS